MKFLEAKRILSAFSGGEPLSFLLAMSGQPEPLDVFLRAAAAERGRQADIRTLPFNTLAQAIHSAPREGEVEVFLLFPWDLLPEVDWRSGIPDTLQDFHALVSAASKTAALLRDRPRARLVYVEAPVPAILPDHRLAMALPEQLRTLAVSSGARVLARDAVSLDNLFRHGTPLSTQSLGDVARTVVECALQQRKDTCKVVVTDLDNTLWHGVVGEDGVEGIQHGPEGLGFPHFIYQTFLRRLKAHGVLLAAVTRNDPDVAAAPFAAGESVLKLHDFVSVVASWNPKSVQLVELGKQLNLGIDSFVFVDDNAVEIAEVEQALPEINVVPFPAKVAGLPEFFATLSSLFHRTHVTAEDQDRTEMYRRRLAGLIPREGAGADVTEFLRSLEMKLTIRDRTAGNRARAVQLINKTNQFNLNGIRRTPPEVDELLMQGGRLFTAGLTDKHGDHGEILACLIDGNQVMRSLVMSCRVFHRRVEHAFLNWLATVEPGIVMIEYIETERNEPLRRFLEDPSFRDVGDRWEADLVAFSSTHADALDLFKVAGWSEASIK